MDKKILIIEEDFDTYEMLKSELERNNFLVHFADDCQEALQKLIVFKPVILMINFHHPLLSTTNFFKYTRAFPMIILGWSREERDILSAFDYGAADYILKPFSPREVVSRVKSILKRIEFTKTRYGKQNSEKQINIGDMILYPEWYVIDLQTRRVELTKKELKVLMLLIDNKKTLLSRNEILKFVWGCDYKGDVRIVDVNISLLRQKIEPNPRKPQYIKTIHGRGYRLDG